MLGQACGEPTGACNVTGQRSYLIDAAENDVIDLSRIHAGALDERADRVGAEIRSVHPRQAALFPAGRRDRKSTRLNSSHDQISYAVFCLIIKITTWPAGLWSPCVML